MAAEATFSPGSEVTSSLLEMADQFLQFLAPVVAGPEGGGQGHQQDQVSVHQSCAKGLQATVPVGGDKGAALHLTSHLGTTRGPRSQACLRGQNRLHPLAYHP